jgi:hypothetical protein
MENEGGRWRPPCPKHLADLQAPPIDEEAFRAQRNKSGSARHTCGDRFSGTAAGPLSALAAQHVDRGPVHSGMGGIAIMMLVTQYSSYVVFSMVSVASLAGSLVSGPLLSRWADVYGRRHAARQEEDPPAARHRPPPNTPPGRRRHLSHRSRPHSQIGRSTAYAALAQR